MHDLPKPCFEPAKEDAEKVMCIENAYFECEVLHIVLKCLGGVYGPGNVGDIEGFSCRVVKTEHYVDLHTTVSTNNSVTVFNWQLGFGAFLPVHPR